MELSAYGITTTLPAGFEGRITKRADPARTVVGPAAVGPRARAKGSPGEVPHPVMHLANFALPEDRGDFGSGAVDIMGPGHLFLCLFEFGPESVGQPLFARQGVPSDLAPTQFSPRVLQRTLPGQAGTQVWFTASARPFCLYAVLGRRGDAARLVPLANQAMASTTVGAR